MSLTEKQKEYQRRHYEKKKMLGTTRTEKVRERERIYNKKYRDCHPEKMKELRQNSREYQRIYTRKWAKLNPEKIRNMAHKWRSNKAAYDSAKQRAKRNNITFTITREYLNSITPEFCPVFGVRLQRGTSCRTQKGPHDNSYSIDRLDPSKGYIEGNVIVVSNRVNRIRSDATVEELNKIAQFYSQILVQDSNQLCLF